MTSDLIKRLREAADRLSGPLFADDALNDEIATIRLAATALERGVWKPDLETVARIIDPVAFDQIGRVDRRRAALAKARDILALPSLVEGRSDEQT